VDKVKREDSFGNITRGKRKIREDNVKKRRKEGIR
jgi:hypothetical protein